MADSLWIIPFGKYKDTDIEDIPDSYLIWLKGEGWFKIKFKDKISIIEKELKFREQFDKHIIEKRGNHD